MSSRLIKIQASDTQISTNKFVLNETWNEQENKKIYIKHEKTIFIVCRISRSCNFKIASLIYERFSNSSLTELLLRTKVLKVCTLINLYPQIIKIF